MQLAVNVHAVSAFNIAAPTLEEITIAGTTFQCFHDYYHNRAVAYRFGMNCQASVGFRVKERPYEFGFSSRSFFKRTCKAQKQLATWVNEMVKKYGTPSCMEDS